MVINLEKINQPVFKILAKLSELARLSDMKIYLIGGTVRDVLLGRDNNVDLDIVVEGDAVKFAETVSKYFEYELKKHNTFKTATVFFTDQKIDFTTARKETYARSGALPTVYPAKLEDDIIRRDFTINTMAINLNKSHFGELIDMRGGYNDLRNKRLKVLHDASFIDDATRILRGIRFECRFNFKFDRKTRLLVKAAIKDNVLSNIHSHRLYSEMKLLLSEDSPVKCLKRLNELCGLKFIHSKINLGKDDFKLLDRIEKVLFAYNGEKPTNRKVSEWLMYFAVLTYKLPKSALNKTIKAYGFKKGEELILRSINGQLKAIGKLNKKVLPSKIFKTFNNLSYEAILFFRAYYYNDKVVLSNIFMFLNELASVKVLLKGSDLMKLNIVPIRIYSKLLEKLLYAKIDKQLCSKSEEMKELMRIYKKLGI